MYRLIKDEVLQAIEYKNENPDISYSSLCKKFNISVSTLRRVRTEGITTLYGDSYITNQDIIDMKNALEEYKNTPDLEKCVKTVADKYNIGKDTLSKFIKKYNIPLVTRKVGYNENIFETIDTHDKAYWLGFIEADGCIFKDELRIKLGAEDKSHLEKFVTFMEGKNLNISKSVHGITGNDLYKVAISNKKLRADLQKCGIQYNKSMNEKPYTDLPNEFIHDYIRGYLDGDGCIYNNLKTISFVGSYDMVKWIKDVFINSLNVYDVKIQTHGKIYKIQWNSNRDKKAIINYLYDNMNCETYLDRKYNLACKILAM